MNRYYKDSWNNKAQNKVVFIIFSLWFFSGFLLLVPLLSPQIENLYFPNDDPKISILAVYGTLSLSLLARVFGGLYLGRLADMHGRKPIIILSLISLTLTMFVSAYLPSVKSTPVDSHFLPYSLLAVLFVLTRIIIGFFVGGYGQRLLYLEWKRFMLLEKLTITNSNYLH
jgi:MFS family permease